MTEDKEYLDKILNDVAEIIEEASQATFAEAEEITEQLEELQSNMIEVLTTLCTDDDS
jgi:hypothetical protein